MPRFISYAQNFEDVILWRALHHIDRGFYVDCGAFDPLRDSVTKAFYDRGWRGINIEPLPGLLRRFVTERPRDVNLPVALSDHAGDAEFYEVEDTGLSTLLPDIARQHSDAGFVIRKIDVPTRKLSDILGQYAPAEIHFMKIDVEGAEDLVLRGVELTRFRPWVILVEATKPLTSEPSTLVWEARLIARGYDCVYFDGLNRFYVAREHADLSQLLAVPPNVFDEFVRYEQLEAVRLAVESLKRSSSWRITAPLRKTKATLLFVVEKLRDVIDWVRPASCSDRSRLRRDRSDGLGSGSVGGTARRVAVRAIR